MQATHPVLLQPILGSSWLKTLAVVVVGSLLLTLSAKVQVPFYPVPLTFQTLVVLMLGVTCGARVGFATVAFYLLQGAMGFPVFAGTPEKGIGLAYMVGPTGGYLVGMAIAAGVTGWLAERGLDRNALSMALTMVVGNLVIYACGLAWLSTIVGVNSKLLAFGLTPFLLGDALKIALATVSVPMVWKLLKK